MSKHFIIIGAGSAIGQAAAEKLAAEGHLVTAVSRQELPAGILSNATRLTGDPLGELPPIEGPIDGILYCPGSINLKPFTNLKAKDFQQDFDINVHGLVATVQQYLPNLKQATQASVVAFSTVAVQTGMAYHASVAAAKGAVEGLIRSLAAEYAPAIRFNAIAPSLIDTPMANRLLRNDKQRAASEERHPLKRIGAPQDIGHMAAFLLAEQASWITGQVIGIDGGMGSTRPL